MPQKDKDARWTKKERRELLRLQDHLGVDKAHKLIRKWDATDAAVHDSQKAGRRTRSSNTGNGVWADSAYRSVQIEAEPEGEGLAEPYPPARRSQLSAVRAQKSANTTLSEGARPVEHAIRPSRTDGRQDRPHHRHRAIEVQDRNDEPRYNIRRLVQLERMAAAPAWKCAHGRSPYGTCKGPRGTPAKRQNGPDRDSPRHKAETLAQLRQKSRKRVLFEFPWGNRGIECMRLLIAVMATSFDFLPIKQFSANRCA